MSLRPQFCQFCEFVSLTVFVALLSMVGACAQTPAPPATSAATTTTNAKVALQAYLGKWRPTSFSEQQNIGSLTISVDELSIEVGNASVSYEIDKQTTDGVIVRVTGRKPSDAFPKIKALAFSLETQTVTNLAPGGATKTRELLRVCYLPSSLDGLALDTKKTSCGNTYTR